MRVKTTKGGKDLDNVVLNCSFEETEGDGEDNIFKLFKQISTNSAPQKSCNIS